MTKELRKWKEKSAVYGKMMDFNKTKLRFNENKNKIRSNQQHFFFLLYRQTFYTWMLRESVYYASVCMMNMCVSGLSIREFVSLTITLKRTNNPKKKLKSSLLNIYSHPAAAPFFSLVCRNSFLSYCWDVKSLWIGRGVKGSLHKIKGRMNCVLLISFL